MSSVSLRYIMSMKWTYFFFIPLLLQIQFKLQMFLIKIAQTNLDITDNYFQFGEEKKKISKRKKNWRGFSNWAQWVWSIPDTHGSIKRGSLKKLSTSLFEMASLSGEQIQIDSSLSISPLNMYILQQDSLVSSERKSISGIHLSYDLFTAE